MTSVYVTEQGATVALSGGRLRVHKGKALLREIRFGEVKQVALMGNVNLTAHAMRALMRHGVDTVFLTAGGRFVGRLAGPLGKNIFLRAAQHRRFAEPDFAMDLARRYVKAKIANKRRLLQRYQRRIHDAEVARALVVLRHARERVDGASDMDALRGVEGWAAATFFGVFGRLIRAPGMSFTKRARRPPPDPVNVLLSFGYTMVQHWIEGLCERAGFDGHLGVLHSIDYGRPSLSLDLMEEFRALIVDTTVLAIVNRRAIGPGDFLFEEPEEADVEDDWATSDASSEELVDRPGLVFRREGVAKWVTAMERRMSSRVFYQPRGEQLTYRQVMREQVYLLARHIEGKEEYQGFEGPT